MGSIHGQAGREGIITMPYQNKKRIELEERRHEVIQMKLAGATERQIAAQFGVSQPQINRDVNHVLKAWAEENMGNASKVHALEMARYSRLLLKWWPIAIGDTKDAPHATQIVMRILARIDAINGIVPNQPLINIEEFVDARQQIINNGMALDDGDYDWSKVPDAELFSVTDMIRAARRAPQALTDGDGNDG